MRTNTDFCPRPTSDRTEPFDDRGIPKSSLPSDFLGKQFTCDLVAGVAGRDRTAFSAVPQCALTQFSKKRLT